MPHSKYPLGIDNGTSSDKITISVQNGRVVSWADEKQWNKFTPMEQVEQDLEIWRIALIRTLYVAYSDAQ